MSACDPNETFATSRLSQDDRRASGPNAPTNVLGRRFRIWSARNEYRVDALQYYFAFLVAQVYLLADNTPIGVRLRLALLQYRDFKIKLISRTHRDWQPEFIPTECCKNTERRFRLGQQ